MDGRIGEKVDFEGLMFVIDEDCTGDFGDFGSKSASDFLDAFFLEGRTGDDSTPDWNTLLSSHPLSSVPGPNCN